MHRVIVAVFTALVVLVPLGGQRQAHARTMERGDANAAQRATPAVVNVSVWKLRQREGEAPRRVKTYGSGFVIDPTGIIVTNKHVIDGALDITAIFNDGNRLHATLLAVAAMLDVAVLKVDSDNPLPVLKWGDSEALQVGDPVLTIGNPLGIGISVSAGIVSALNRDIQDTPFDQYIQTDAAINHGNSGGPLINVDGEVIGIDTALYNPDSDGFIGIGFAIPSESAKFVVDRLLDPSHPMPGWIGVTLQDMTPELSEALGLRGSHGSIIAAVDADGPAARAGLQPGAVLLGLNGVHPQDSRAFMRAIVQIDIGKPAALSVWRSGNEETVTVTVAEWPNEMPGGGMIGTHMADAMIQRMPDPGVRLAPLTDAARQQYGIDAKLTGVLVASVEADCEARDLGIVPGDVVTAVQGAPVSNPDEVRRAVQLAHEQRRPYLAVLVQNKSAGARWVSLSMGGTR